jgi:hypothetical protein
MYDAARLGLMRVASKELVVIHLFSGHRRTGEVQSLFETIFAKADLRVIICV